jgi:hypothetical protein
MYLQTFRQYSDSRTQLVWQALDRQQSLMLLGFYFGHPRSVLAEAQKTPNLVTQVC